MLRDKSTIEILTHPLTVAASMATAIGQALGIKYVVAVTGVVWAQVSTVFTALSVSAFTLAPEIPWLPREPLMAASLIIGGLYVLKLGDRVLDRIEARL